MDRIAMAPLGELGPFETLALAKAGLAAVNRFEPSAKHRPLEHFAAAFFGPALREATGRAGFSAGRGLFRDAATAVALCGALESRGLLEGDGDGNFMITPRGRLAIAESIGAGRAPCPSMTDSRLPW